VQSQVLGYADYRNFEAVVEKTRTACFNSGQRVDDHFVGIDDMVGIGKRGQRPVKTVMMSRYACYLVIQNADPAKVLEYFAGFKWSCKTTEEFTNIVLTRFVADPNLLKKGTGDFIVKFLHEYSHGQNFTRPVSASMFEAKAVTESILEFIRLADKDHYDKLQSLC
jgi:hypothetical protein